VTNGVKAQFPDSIQLVYVDSASVVKPVLNLNLTGKGWLQAGRDDGLTASEFFGAQGVAHAIPSHA
jgi:hypothetical protein